MFAPKRLDGGCHVAGARTVHARRRSMPTQSGMVVGVRAVECGVATGDDRPRVRVGGGFAGEIPGFELREGGVDVVGVEPTTAAIRSSASSSTTLSTSVWNAGL